MSNELVHPELAGVHVDEDSGDLSRGEVILKGALAAGAVYGLNMVGPFARKALATADADDVDLLNFALAYEYLETAFYREAYERVRGSELDFLVGLLSDYEPQHATALIALIKDFGGKPVASPKFEFTYSDHRELLKLAQTFEETAVGAYNGIAPSIKSGEALGLVGSIVQVEGRFAAAVRLKNDEFPAPGAFDAPLTESQVSAVLDPFVR